MDGDAKKIRQGSVPYSEVVNFCMVNQTLLQFVMLVKTWNVIRLLTPYLTYPVTDNLNSKEVRVSFFRNMNSGYKYLQGMSIFLFFSFSFS